MEKIKIDKSVPMPSGRKGKCKWPWHEMKVGDSFFAKGYDHNSFSGSRAVIQMRTGFKFSIARQNGGVRVWRTK